MSSCKSRGGSEPLACDNRCFAYCKTGPCEPAIRDCTRATELDPKSVMAYGDRA